MPSPAEYTFRFPRPTNGPPTPLNCDIYKIEKYVTAKKPSHRIRYDSNENKLSFQVRMGEQDENFKEQVAVNLNRPATVRMKSQSQEYNGELSKWLVYDSECNGRYDLTCPHSESSHLTSGTATPGG